jgi:hypothetical protein
LTIAYLAENFPHVIGKAMALTLALNSALTVLMHLGAGVITDRFGIAPAMWLGPLGAAGALLFLHTHHFSNKLSKKPVVQGIYG